MRIESFLKPVLVCALLGLISSSATAYAATPTVDALGSAVRQDLAPALRTFLALSFLSFIPIVLIGMTSFTRIIVVLALLRHALGIPQTPPNSVLITLAMFLTLFSMGPVVDKVYADSINPYMTEQIGAGVAIERASDPIREFMVRQTRESDLLAVLEMARVPPPKSMQDIRFTHLAAAFLLSELKTAFQIGFVIFLPFLLIDLVVAAILMALGMIMLPPTTISLPLKILLFVLIDGWVLVSRTLLGSFWT
ncbi:flagellar type III secretion system pore protein FliP [Stenotrophomonas sp.]|uniref:flagellar type III secretion system pore protein FliP n=1 Tax=Stenotrophomonas sp. TaxID=69392 RepID=UPI00289B2511|nr:flagellar type III secretion system pore protein FliP [Stenotrophomonas sp.]